MRANEPAGAYRLVSVDDPSGPRPLPGQFYMLAAAERWGGGEGERPYLARAFSVCRTRGTQLDFLVDGIGPGTRRLAALTSGEALLVVGPLGLGFSAPREVAGTGEGALLVGGGIGIAPLVILSEALAAEGVEARALVGFRSHAQCAAAELLGEGVQLATEDGSLGHRGLVTDLLLQALEKSPRAAVYACGPPAMLEAVRRICSNRTSAQLAMEETMACGFGACYGCVVRTTSGYRRLCVDGPVVSAADLDERWLPE